MRDYTPDLPLDEFVRRQCLGGEPVDEYKLCKSLTSFLNFYLPSIDYRVDFAGSNLSKAQAAKLKAVNKYRGLPDLEIFNPRAGFTGLHIELKKAGTKLIRTNDAKAPLVVSSVNWKGKKLSITENKIRKKGDWFNEHLEEQAKALAMLSSNGRACFFGVGKAQCLTIILSYLTEDRRTFLKRWDNNTVFVNKNNKGSLVN